MGANKANASQNADGDDEEEMPDVPDKVSLSQMPVYVVDKRLGKGGFGQVCLGRRLQQRKVTPPNKPNQVAIKFEAVSGRGCSKGSPPYEWRMYQRVAGCHGIPKFFAKGTQGNFHIMIMELLGPSLWDILHNGGKEMSLQYVACVAVEILRILQDLHERGYVHGDIKPENMLLGASGTPNANRLYLVDLGLAQRYKNFDDHLPYHQNPNEFRGTIRYASVHAHLGRIASRRDDLESLAYTLVFLLDGGLPWQGFQGDDKGYQVCKKKMDLNAERLCRRDWPDAFSRFTDSVLALRYDEEPKYAAYIALFKPLTGDAALRPIALHLPEAAAAAAAGKEKKTPGKASGRKRMREASSEDTEAVLLELEDDDEEAPRKRTRTGWADCQWIAVFNQRRPMKQRYHYNVTAARMQSHVDKGYQEQLHISSVTSCKNLWAIIMEAQTPYTKQVYRLVPGTFMPRDWITEKWEEGYYITSVAGSDDGSTMVVMSRGTKWTQQSYKVDSTFPYEWIKKKWREDFYVTSMASSGKPSGKQQWAVVMSRDTEFRHQVVEIDFQYPSEGIHYHWNQGYRITAVAATHHQAAVVMSLPKRGGYSDRPQETLRTSTFPTEHVKEKWDNEMYIEHVAYGRTVS